MRFRIVAAVRVQHEFLRHRELRGEQGADRAKRYKWDEGQDWHIPRRLRAGYETLPRLVPEQGEQDFLTLSDNSKRTFPNELSIRLKKNRHLELVRVGDSLENQEGLHFQMTTCATVFQGELLYR